LGDRERFHAKREVLAKIRPREPRRSSVSLLPVAASVAVTTTAVVVGVVGEALGGEEVAIEPLDPHPTAVQAPTWVQLTALR
jgi:hypothetical protein